MTNLKELAENLRNAWTTHTGAEPSESVLGRAIDELLAALAQQWDQPTKRQYETALRQWNHWKTYALELQAKMVKYEGGAPMNLNATAPATQQTERDIRGTLAKLKCWHRLTEEEAAELVTIYAGAAPASQPNGFQCIGFIDGYDRNIQDGRDLMKAPKAVFVQAAPAAQPDTRKVIEQMVGALFLATPNFGYQDSYRSAVTAGQQWLEENK